MRNADWILCLLVGPGSPDGMMHANIGPSPLPPPPPVSSWIHDVSSVVIYAHIFCCVIAVYFYCFFHILFFTVFHILALSKQHRTSSNCFHRLVAVPFWFCHTKHLGKTNEWGQVE